MVKKVSHIFVKTTAFILSLFLIVPFCSACNSEIPYENSSVLSIETSVENSNEDSKQSENISSNVADDESFFSEESIVPQDTVVSFLACPDNIFHPSVYYDALERAARNNNTKTDYSDLNNAKYDFNYIYENVSYEIKSADIAYINQETLIGGTSGAISGYPCFNSPKPLADKVIDLGFDIVNVAHNHMLDSGDTRYLENCNKVVLTLSVIIPTKHQPKILPLSNAKVLKSRFLPTHTVPTASRFHKTVNLLSPLLTNRLSKNK